MSASSVQWLKLVVLTIAAFVSTLTVGVSDGLTGLDYLTALNAALSALAGGFVQKPSDAREPGAQTRADDGASKDR